MTRTFTREDTLRRVISELDDRRDGILPMHLAGVSEHFDATSLIGALQLRWHATLSGQVERELASRPFDQADAVTTAWARARDTHPGVRAALDEAAAHPADEEMAANMRRAAQKEHAMLGAMAALAAPATPGAVTAGARIVRRARDLRPEPAATVARIPHERRPGSSSLLSRVRHLVA